jgi:hypothetical protein
MNGAVPVALTTTSQSVTNLAENALYYVQVRAYATLSTGEVFYSDWSTARGVTTDIASLGAPVVSVYGAAGSIYAEWGAVTNAAGYVLIYGTQPDMSDAASITLTATSQSITGLNVNTIYYVQVRAYANLSSGGVLYSGWSEEKSASTDISSLDTAYTSVSALTKGFTANWNAITYANGYELRYSTKKSMSGAKTVSLTSTSKSVTGLEENKVYYVQVRSYSTLSTGQNLYSDWSAAKTVTTDIKSLSAPTASVSAASKGFTVKWGKVKNAAGYEIRYSTKKSMKGAKKVTVTSKSKKITKLKAKTTYYVQVRAYAKRSTGKTVYSKWGTVKKVKTKK